MKALDTFCFLLLVAIASTWLAYAAYKKHGEKNELLHNISTNIRLESINLERALQGKPADWDTLGYFYRPKEQIERYKKNISQFEESRAILMAELKDGSIYRTELTISLLSFLGAIAYLVNKRRQIRQEVNAVRENLRGRCSLFNKKHSKVVCPFCAEKIKPQAIVCKHCGRDLPKDTP
ncbi:hypothetical protein LJC46_04245 [Desulfovibrio sp. OttesenSCG-928-G15]|nr:hypothetical protein [Desulfovibrio sp. OttesenSCG-928-G15]